MNSSILNWGSLNITCLSLSEWNVCNKAGAWVGWIVMKAGDECSNYFIHEMGHSQSMQHFDNGVAFDWKIEDEYPSGDGIYTPDLPWGYDSVLRQFRTWFDREFFHFRYHTLY